jgi:hypothetical protein
LIQNLSDMTTADLKRYLSEHRNDEAAFRAALEVLMSRRDPAMQQPYPFDLENPEAQVEELLKGQLGQTK